jgi:D-inositol-3-phosphate glycosyltransferase
LTIHPQTHDHERTPVKPLAIVSMHASPIAPLGSGENGGMNVYVRAVCEELSRRGIATQIFSRRVSKKGPHRVRLAEHSWVRQLEVGPPAELDKTTLFDLLPEFTDAVLQSAAPDAFSLVHSHYWLSGWVAARLRDAWGVPWFHTAHTLARVKNERAASGAVLEPDHRIAVEQAIVRNSDRLIASSLEEAEDLERLYGAPRSRVSVVPPGVDLTVFRPRRTDRLRAQLSLDGARVIVFAGRLERLKGAETLLRAFSLLVQTGAVDQPLALVVIGDDSHNGALESHELGGERGRLQALAESLGVESQVRFVGPVAQAELAGYLTLADVCVVPSYSESFGLVALEAEACGTPVVAARVGGLPSVVKDGLTGYTLVSHDPAQYAERIARILQDDELRRCFSRRSRLVATQFTWAETVDRLLVEYGSPASPELRPAAIAG